MPNGSSRKRPKRPGKQAAINLARKQNDALRARPVPTKMGEPHRVVPKAVSAILEDLLALTDDDLGLFFWSISEGMWDEWDTSLVGGLEIFGEAEMRVAIRSAVFAAKAVEKE
jgi:hypothetical protein